MTPKDDRVFAFLTDIKHQRDVTRRLFEMAEERPELVMAYLESLPPGWEQRLDETDLLTRLRAIASEALRRSRSQ